MPRKPRNDVGNEIYHVINRANKRVAIFTTDGDYWLFQNTLAEAQKGFSMRILAYINMPNHLHLVLYPDADGQLSKFMHWFTTTLTQRWHRKHDTTGTGHLFQGRYKSFVVTKEKYLRHLLLYVERNALRANLVQRAESWRWSSLWIRENGTSAQKKLLAEWPIEIQENYLSIINENDDPEIIQRIRASVKESAALDEKYVMKKRGGRPAKAPKLKPWERLEN